MYNIDSFYPRTRSAFSFIEISSVALHVNFACLCVLSKHEKNVASWACSLVFMYSVPTASRILPSSVFSSWMLFACRKALDVGVLIVLKPPGLLHCETPTDTKAPCTLPTGRRRPRPAPVHLAVRCPLPSAQMKPVRGAPRAIRQGEPPPRLSKRERA